MEWQSMMERSTPSMSYQAWRHEPETGPTVYRSRTVFEDATPELVKDFFWDDEFRPKWDTMLAHCKILEECPQTGTMIVHWIKKRSRIYHWPKNMEAGKSYYCVTKGVSYPGLHKRDKPRRVELYFSSWLIRAGVRHGMWGAVKKLHSGVRAYQNMRKVDASLSRSAIMANITTKIPCDGSMESLGPAAGEPGCGKRQKDHGLDWKWLIVGGTVAVVCGLHSGLGKALLLGAGQRLARR
ncbi:hypothetical protein G4B88_025170 [Cannabis sativa]|uniref:START domain-containing protein n=1 Tax=Cannabis sativa TaxID=3483 RepID=A0A7J6E603_CANSA|nr:hypothetical protein G4B88_025170 [Cannabis sativa]